jgi:hypothetical protein
VVTAESPVTTGFSARCSSSGPEHP